MGDGEQKMKIAFIGGGNMGEAIIAAVVSRGLSSPKEITVSDVSEARRNYLKEKFKVAVTPDNRSAVTDAGYLQLMFDRDGAQVYRLVSGTD